MTPERQRADAILFLRGQPPISIVTYDRVTTASCQWCTARMQGDYDTVNARVARHRDVCLRLVWERERPGQPWDLAAAMRLRAS